MSSKKIYFFLSHFHGGGAELITIILANWLADNADLEIKLLVLDDNGPLINSVSNKIQIHRLNDSKSSNILFKYMNIFKKLVVLSSKNITLVVCSEGNPWLLGMFFKNRILWVHANLSSYFYGLTFIRRFLYKVCLIKYNKIIFVSNTSFNSFYDNYFFSNKLKFLKVIYNPSKYSPIIKSKIYNGNLKIISIGRYDEVKRHHLSIYVVHELRMQGYEYKLDIYGDGFNYNDLNVLIKKLNLENYVTLKGYISDLRLVYLQSDFFISCSSSEGFGLSMLEAMSFGIPAIYMSPCEGLDEISFNGRYAIAINNNNCIDMANIIIKLSNNKDLYNKYSNLGLQRARDFSLDKFFKNWVNLLL